MADKPLLDVLRVSLGIPDAFANLNYDQQKSMLAARIDMKQFKTADGVAAIVKKYLAMATLTQPTLGKGASDPILTLLTANTGGSHRIYPGGASNFNTINLLV